jgi:uncharacterized repeat protein (TIGR03803 family)
MTPNSDGSWTETVIHHFSNGSSMANLCLDTTGNLYGTTIDGGAYGQGSAFQMKPNTDGSWTYQVIHQFTNGRGGGSPDGGLILDAAGDLYGTNSGGGAYGAGNVFMLRFNPDKGRWEEYVLHQFTGGKDGATPSADLVFDAAGNLYGTSLWGGVYGWGTVFKLRPNPAGGWTEYVLHQFTNGNDGGTPNTGLIFDVQGNLYGETFGGGASGVGEVFEITAVATQ